MASAAEPERRCGKGSFFEDTASNWEGTVYSLEGTIVRLVLPVAAGAKTFDPLLVAVLLAELEQASVSLIPSPGINIHHGPSKEDFKSSWMASRGSLKHPQLLPPSMTAPQVPDQSVPVGPLILQREFSGTWGAAMGKGNHCSSYQLLTPKGTFGCHKVL